MSKGSTGFVVPLAAAACAAAALAFWLTRESAVRPALRVPGTDRAPAADGPGKGPPIRGTLAKEEGVPATNFPGAWPGFRGPARTGVSVEDVPLATAWPADGPPVLWRIGLGEGHGGAAVLNGRAYLLDYDATNRADVVRCLSLADGRDIWRYSYPVRVKRNHGMSRTVPAVTAKYAVTLGPKCHVFCLNPENGEFRWSIDLVRDYGTMVPQWYAGQCPLIDGDRAILAPAGSALVIAVDCETGRVLWETPNPRAWAMTHASLTPVEFRGRRMYVYCGSGGVAGVSAEDGALLWDTTAWKISIATVPSPVSLGEGRIFLSGGYEAGSMMLQLTEKDGKITAEPSWKLPARDFGATQQTPILFNGYLYGVRPDGQMTCLAPEGRIVWTSGPTHRFGIGPFLIARGLIYAIDDAGVLTLAAASPDGYRQHAQAKVLPGRDSWGPLAIAGGRLIARDLTTMVCLDVSASAGGGKGK